jgi:hypothetical protein
VALASRYYQTVSHVEVIELSRANVDATLVISMTSKVRIANVFFFFQLILKNARLSAKNVFRQPSALNAMPINKYLNALA